MCKGLGERLVAFLQSGVAAWRDKCFQLPNWPKPLAHKGRAPFIPECSAQAVETSPPVAELCSTPCPVAKARGRLSHTATRAPVPVPRLHSFRTSLGETFLCSTSSPHPGAPHASLLRRAYPFVHQLLLLKSNHPDFNGR